MSIPDRVLAIESLIVTGLVASIDPPSSSIEHTVTVQQEHSMGAIVASVVVVHWVGAIEVGAFRDSVRIAVPDRACVVGRVEHAALTVSTSHGLNGDTGSTYNESECSPRPYKLGSFGRLVRSLKYWFSKTICAAEVSKRTSPLLRRTTEKLKGSSSYLNSRSEALLLPPLPSGRSNTESGTW
jgi:hypothetical protein